MIRPVASASLIAGLLPAARLFLLVGLFLAVLGAKLTLIRTYGSDVPYMDQWDAQAGALYIPHAEHRLTIAAFFAPHNEHRIAATRAVNYGLTIANRQWDPLVEMTVNAIVHATFAGALLLLARRHVRGIALVAVVAVIATVFVLPFAWENTLAGFQSPFYFLAWAALVFLWLVVPAAPLSGRWWLGILVGVAGLGTMSSGFFCAAAALAIAAGRAAWWERRWTWRDAVAMMVYVAMCVAGIAFMTRVPGHAPLKAGSPWQWLQVLCKVLAWPSNRWIVSAFIVQLPLVVFALGRIRARKLIDDDAVLLALALWCWLQTAAVAYARANFGMNNSPRYFDLFAIGIVLNSIVLFRGWNGGRVMARGALVAAWSGLFIFGVCDYTESAHVNFIDRMPAAKAAERVHLAQFVRNGNLAALEEKRDELPLPDPARLAYYLSHRAIRALLPVSLRPPIPLHPAESDGFALAPADERPGHPQGEAWRATHGPARFVSEPIPGESLPMLQFTFAGDDGLTPDILHLESADGHRSLLAIQRIAGDRWQTAHLPLPPGGMVRLVVRLPPGPHGFAFANPVEMGRGSFYVHHILKNATALASIGVGLLLASLIVLVGRERRITNG